MKNNFIIFYSILIVILFFDIGCNKQHETGEKSTSQDSTNIVKKENIAEPDNLNFKTVTIGKQLWMSENLNVSHYRNGDIIPHVQNDSDWSKLSIGAWCYYDNDSKNGNTYGRLYNWYAVNDSRGLAPVGWHIPNEKDWTQLIKFLGGEEKAGNKMKDTILWNNPKDVEATNSCGFSALPAGYRSGLYGTFIHIGYETNYWSSDGLDNKFDNDSMFANYRSLSNLKNPPELYSIMTIYNGLIDQSNINNKKGGLSVRCIKD